MEEKPPPLDDRHAPGILVGPFALAVATLYTIAIVLFASNNSDFISDDLVGFWMARHMRFGAYLLEPIDIHFVPLDRLIAYLLNAFAPMNFKAGLGVLVAFHALAVAYLWKTLAIIRPASQNWWLLLMYCTHMYLGVLFVWWTARLRLPCIALSVMSAYYYLQYRNHHRRLDYALLLGCVALAFGFFIKAALIPATLLGIEICFWKTTPSAERKKNAIALTAVAALSWTWITVWFVRMPHHATTLTLSDWRFHLAAQKTSWLMFGYSTLGFLYKGPSATTLLVVAIWVAIVGFAIVRRPSSAIAWLVLVLLISANNSTTALPASRATMGTAGLVSPRYYFELMFPLVIFAAIGLRDVGASQLVSAGQSSRHWKSRFDLASVVFVACVAIHGYWGFTSLSDANPVHRLQKRFLAHLKTDLARVGANRSTPVPLIDAPLPPYVLGWVGPFRYQSKLLEAMGFRPNLVKSGTRGYRISRDGYLIKAPH